MLADDTILATAKDLESITFFNVHGGTAPDLGLGTLTATIHRQGFA